MCEQYLIPAESLLAESTITAESLIAVNTCPTGPALDGDVHINIDLLSRLSGLTRREILATCSRIECLSFAYEVTSHDESSHRKNILRLTYKPLSIAAEQRGNWTTVVHAMFSFIDDNLCPVCRVLAVDKMDFSALSTLARFPDSHAQPHATAQGRDPQPTVSNKKDVRSRKKAKTRRSDGSS